MSLTDECVISTPSYATLTPSQLLFAGAVQFGSRALGVETENSDYDFAILRSNYNNLIENYTPYTEKSIENYFKVIPPSGHPTLVQEVIDGKSIDILIVDKQEHINIIHKSIQDIKILPYFQRVNKQQRIHWFEHTLLRNGFKLQWKYKVIIWTTKVLKVNTGLWFPRI